MTHRLQRFANLLVFAASVAYGLWSLANLFLVSFNLGENESALDVLGILVFGLVPLPATLVALRWRKIGATIFCVVASLLVAGYATDPSSGIRQNGLLKTDILVQLILVVLPLLVFAAFYSITDLLRWPKLLAKKQPTA